MAHTVILTAAGTTASAQPIPGLGGRTAFVLIAIVVVAIAAIAVAPLLLDVRRATAWRQQLTDRLIDRAADDQDVRDFLRDLREPRGVRGLTRSIIAVLILALVGFALAVAMLSSGTDSGDLRKTIVTSLMTVLATVAGFYFGSLGAQNSAEDARRQSAARSVATVTAAPGAGETASAGAGVDPSGDTAADASVEPSPEAGAPPAGAPGPAPK
ncbi:hypothetical protein GA0115240_167032 [Streptomyces sp. DvalAA-14]|uniref:hypothetical protein n=1 Tax=unclassified Streptomyces TaxID=2593676 RepID=UPI00081B82EA|nr:MULTISPECIES: hypothetical protein [unclassified Streptomyces]MYS24684.1 hypothetical protein [Streptomyces sp. SID4948]SCE48404.1 hypothetical protein GA0115240_167032 [Streptomyces sp. DvalAA-14]